MNWANDINIKAIHTYMANAPSHVHPFAGSIDDLQRLALEANFRDNVPEVGSVDFVAAGSPCQGFSSLTQDKTDPRQRKNQSLVAAFASFIDTYRPKYGLLENVMAIVQSRGKRAEDVFCQLICAIVGMGYQTQFWVLDAWTHGSPQSRSRVFLSFAAPGLSLPKMPLHSHSHYQENIRTNTLGWLPNRQPMVERLVMPTPFKFVTTQQATADLPDIQDGKPDICVGFPDHRVAYSITKRVRNQFSVIPTHPHGMSLATSWQGGHGVMTKADRDFFPFKGKKANGAKSRAWSRVPPNKIMATITASGATPADAFTGGVLHWNQDRVITVMESRRAQGFLDHEVILGRPREQWRVVGNSVAREVSLALGLSFREAWLGSLIDGDETQPDEKVPVRLPTTNYVVADSADSTTANTRDNSRTSTPSSMTSRSTCRTVPAKRPLSSTISVEEFVAEASRATRPRAASDGLRGSTALSAGKKPLTPSERESTMDERPPASPELVRIVSDVV
ncbi:DNA (cytosine-5)-methyltransferase 3 [Colletotrichum orbiculare MAFF 240422]|uniref:DNA (cytosine-5-)-methyltransferase n=2 Tax=Colletotrichum orbiculare species complex TaxID=2707354 RepID=N4VR78_COLOR|nr:DNA (cytosine-5)-methyltransferase 3 [Colletotrichum orbiculare MAFF 240422]